MVEYSKFIPPISGYDIMEEFSIGPGPLVGEFIERIAEAITNGDLPLIEDKSIYLNYLHKFFNN